MARTSMTDSPTMQRSNLLKLSIQKSQNPMPVILMAISTVKKKVNTKFVTRSANSSCELMP